MPLYLSLVVCFCVFFLALIADSENKKQTIVEVANNMIGHYEVSGQAQVFQDSSKKDSGYNKDELSRNTPMSKDPVIFIPALVTSFS